MLSVDEALTCILGVCKLQDYIQKDISESSGYILAEDVYADRDYPPFHRAAMDGYAVNYSDIESGNNNFSVSAVIHAGDSGSDPCKKGHCIKIMTGASVPVGANVLFKVEDCEVNDDTVTLPLSGAKEWLNIDCKGQVYKNKDLILKKGSVVDMSTVNSLASVGKQQIRVYKKLSVSIISTGTEVVGINQNPLDYQIRDSNYFSLLYGLQNLGFSVSSYERVDDDIIEITKAIKSGLKSDVLLITGGVSMGDADFIPKVLQDCSVEKIFHKVKIKPGKPLWFGKTKTNVVFGIPGNPFSVMVSFKVFIEPFLRKSYGDKLDTSLKLPLTKQKHKKGDRSEYFLVKLVSTVAGTGLEPVSHKGSGDISAGVSTAGIAFHSNDKQTLDVGDVVEFIPWE